MFLTEAPKSLVLSNLLQSLTVPRLKNRYSPLLDLPFLKKRLFTALAPNVEEIIISSAHTWNIECFTEVNDEANDTTYEGPGVYAHVLVDNNDDSPITRLYVGQAY